MVQTHTCALGHRWDSNGPPEEACPVCSSAAASWDRSQGSTFADELPPPPESSAATVIPTGPARRVPAVPGYEVLGELGRGGMGVVYQARHLGLKRPVALKVILSGEHADPRDLARFRAEAEAVARLQHPNIVQIFEVGEHDGRPYFALELVKGGSLAQRLAGAPLPATAAAELVETLARAMDYAHSQGVVHRDLKPANILLQRPEDRGQRTEDSKDDSSLSSVLCPLSSSIPKVADFGLAKRLDASAAPTQTGQVMGTPCYMAPEQAAGRAKQVGPAADVYALGAILYECLTGRPPFRGDTALETLRQVVFDEPVALTRLQPKMPRDLETVCLKCLRKEPARRYASAGELAEDLRRFRAGEPVRARPVGLGGRGLRWAKRRPAVAALVAVVFVAALSLLGLGLASDLRIRAQQAEIEQRGRAARANYGRALQAVKQIIEVAQNRLGHVPRMERHRMAMLEQALTLYEDLLKEDGADRDVRQDAGRAYQLAGDVLELLGEPAKAEDYHRRSLELWTGLAREFPDQRDCRRGLASAYKSLGWLFKEMRRYPAAEDALTESLRLREELCGEDSGIPEDHQALGAAHYHLGILYWLMSRYDTAEAHHREGLRLWGRLASESPATPERWYDLGAAHLSFGSLLRDMGRLADAETEYREALACKQKVRDEDFVAQPFNRQELARIHLNLGGLLARTGRLREAEGQYQETIRLDERLAEYFPAAPEFRRDLASAHAQLAGVLGTANRPEAAAESSRRAQGLWEKLAQDFADRPGYQNDLAVSHDSLGDLLARAGQLADAERAYRRGLALWDKLAEGHPGQAEYRGRSAADQARLAGVLTAQGRSEAAEAAHRAALDLRRRLAEEFPAAPEYRNDLANGYDGLGNLLRGHNRLDEAEEAHRQALDLHEKLAREFPKVPEYRASLAHSTHSLGLLLEHAGRFRDAEDAFRRALAVYEALAAESPADPGHRRNLAVVVNSLANILKDTGRPGDAEKAHRLALGYRKALADEFPEVPEYRQQLAHSYYNLGLLFLETERYWLAEPPLRQAVAILDQLRRELTSQPDYRSDLAAVSNSLGNLLRQTRRFREAETTWQQVLALQQQLAQEFPAQPGYRFELAVSHSNLGILLHYDLRRPDDAAKLFAEAQAIAQKLVAEFPAVPTYRHILAEALHGQGVVFLERQELAEARRRVEEAIGQHREALKPFPAHPLYTRKLREHYLLLADILIRSHDHAGAANAVAEHGKLCPDRWEDFFQAARLLAGCIPLARQDEKLAAAEREAVANGYAERAVRLLKDAREKGWKDPRQARAVPEFEPLRAREDYRKLVGP